MLELVLRIAFSLLVVLGLMWGLARLVRRPLAGRGGGALAVLARQQLGRTSSVAIVKVVDRALVLGVTEGQISLLGEADLAALEQPAEPVTRREPVLPGPVGADPRDDRSPADAGPLAGSALSPAAWRQTVDFLRERTVRH